MVGPSDDTKNGRQLTGNTRKQLPSKALNLAVGEWHEAVSFEEVEHALAQQVHDDADVVPEVKAVPKMYTPVPVLLVVRLERLENSKLDLARISILLHGANDLDGDQLIASPVVGLDDLAEGTLAKQLDDTIYHINMR